NVRWGVVNRRSYSANAAMAVTRAGRVPNADPATTTATKYTGDASRMPTTELSRKAAAIVASVSTSAISPPIRARRRPVGGRMALRSKRGSARTKARVGAPATLIDVGHYNEPFMVEAPASGPRTGIATPR